MASHVRILAWFNIVIGALGVLAACITFAGASILPVILAVAAQEAADIPIAILQVVVTVVVGVILVLSLPSLILGFGLYNLRPWARILGFVISGLNLLHFPLGTAISLYAFWVLLKPETEQLFQRPAVTPT
ncbi:MAG: hypothetical protein HY821_24780 [Acidobacteria bacterium]|nr:hypothetical protein [Acidobacteriota bacterium]